MAPAGVIGDYTGLSWVRIQGEDSAVEMCDHISAWRTRRIEIHSHKNVFHDGGEPETPLILLDFCK